MTDDLYDNDALAEARAIGHAEGLQAGHAEGLRQAAIAGAGREEGRKAGFEQGFKESSEAYRLRVKTILESPAAKGRETAARHLALETDMTAAAAVAALQTMATASSIRARAVSTFTTADPTTLQ